MLQLGITDLIAFSFAVVMFLIFAAVWIIKSESARGVLKEEIRRLKSQAEAYERDKFVLLEKMNSPERAEDDGLLTQTIGQNEALEKENKRLKIELEEAKNSLEEIYKAFVDKNTKKGKSK